MIEQGVEEYLNKLEQIITLAKKSVFGDYKMVDEGSCLECISNIRKLLPSELSDARLIKKNAQDIIDGANKNAQNIINKAQQDAAQLVSDSKIMEDAQREADKIINQASDYANQMVGQAYSDLARLYDDAEDHAKQIVEVIMSSKAKVFPQQQQFPGDQMPQ